MDAPDILDIFAPVKCLRNEFKYQDLSNHKFLSTEKTWLCEELNNVHNLLNCLLPSFCKKHNTSSLALQYSIPKRTVANWMTRYLQGFILYDSVSKRPSQIDDIGKEDIKALCQQAVLDKLPISHESLQFLMIDAKVETASRKKLNALSETYAIPSESTIRSFMNDNGIEKRKGQILTDARRKACQDPRMSYSWYLCCEAFSANLPGEKKWNADGSTFEINDKGEGMYLTLKNETELTSRIQVANGDSSLPIYIKYMAMANACGNSSPLVLIIAIEDMIAEEFQVYEIKGMCITTNIDDVGYMIFCKSRAGNANLWAWYFTNIAVPTISRANAYYNQLNIDNTPTRNFLSTDGEAIIIKQAFNIALQKLFADNLIDYVKG